MGLTVAAHKTGKSVTYFGDRKVVFKTVTFDSSYPTGGEAITLAQLGLTEVDFVAFSATGVTYTFAYDYTNNKIIAVLGDGTQVADTTDLATVVVRIMAIGK
jgi:hypothetical protein